MHPSFEGLGISPELLRVVRELKFVTPTPVQLRTIPAANAGKDVLGIAQTGTGKTLAFGIPMVQALLEGPGRGLVLVPTRELALQVDETMRKLGNPFDIRSVILIGGMDMSTQIKLLKKENIRVLIATPGRLLDHFETRSLKGAELSVVVLDEADRMLDLGFAPQIERLAKHLPAQRRTMLFSATMPDAVARVAALYMREPERVEVSPSGAAPEKITQDLYVVRQENKLRLLAKLLERCEGSALVFARTKSDVWKLTRSLSQMGHPVIELHSDRTPAQRRHALKGFKEGLYRVLVATDIAARGIDVQGIELVVNFDLPDEDENYVHRIGRTGRAGRAGRSVTLAEPGDGPRVRRIEKLTRTPMRLRQHPDVPAAAFDAGAAPRSVPPSAKASRHAAGRPEYGPPRRSGEERR